MNDPCLRATTDCCRRYLAFLENVWDLSIREQLLFCRQEAVHETAVDVFWRDFRIFLPGILRGVAEAVVKRLRRTLDVADDKLEAILDYKNALEMRLSSSTPRNAEEAITLLNFLQALLLEDLPTDIEPDLCELERLGLIDTLQEYVRETNPQLPQTGRIVRMAGKDFLIGGERFPSFKTLIDVVPNAVEGYMQYDALLVALKRVYENHAARVLIGPV